MKNRENMVEDPIEKTETATDERAGLVKAIVTDIAQALQECVYVREEGNTDDPNEAIVYCPFVKINNLLVETAKKYGFNEFHEDSTGLEKVDE